MSNRFTRAQLLESASRRRIMAFVGAHPGCSTAQIARGAGLGWTATDHHLTLLHRRGMLTAKVVEGRRRYSLPKGVTPP